MPDENEGYTATAACVQRAIDRAAGGGVRETAPRKGRSDLLRSRGGVAPLNADTAWTLLLGVVK